MIAPVEKQVTVDATAEEAFTMFTRHIGRWWPLGTHSVFQSKAVSVSLEEKAGGQIIERNAEGETSIWGTVTTWDPPRRLVFTWHPGREASTAQEVEVRFEPDDTQTRVMLVHRGWELLGDAAEAMRDMYNGGWSEVFGRRFGGAFSMGRHTLIALRHLPGPQWKPGIEFREQPGVDGHFGFMQRLFNNGTLLFGGPLLGGPGGGIAVLRGVDAEQAKVIAATDPAVEAGLLSVEIWPWLVPMTSIDLSR